MIVMTEYAVVFCVTVPIAVATGALVGAELHEYLTTVAVACSSLPAQ